MLLLAETTRRLTSSVHKLYKETQAQERTHDLFNTNTGGGGKHIINYSFNDDTSL